MDKKKFPSLHVNLDAFTPATDAEKDTVHAAIEKLRETAKGDDVEAIKADTKALEEAFYPIAQKMYADAQAQQGAGPDMGGTGAGPDGTYYSADFEDKSDN